MGRKWTLFNPETDEKLVGQFEAEDLTEDLSNTFAEKWALNREHAITQFVHGNTDLLTFTGRFFQKNDTDRGPTQKLMLLKRWKSRDRKLRRPSILSFWVGDAHVILDWCVIEAISPITYDRPTSYGGMRGTTFSITLRQWWPYDVELGVATGETRYHNAKQQDYYEMLAYREYGKALWGDTIRQRHPTQSELEIGDVVKLPSSEAMRGTRVKPQSIALLDKHKTDSPQWTLWNEVLARLDRPRRSHVVLE
ncbi:hypothetical protein LCGC14_1269500 [marine sediment metagenome]|uniref:Uncharacterized protein n=1 Tax=marine sediment metagenome TaxID=412755 RepID=A0A0F9LJJ2_9ZZZZ